MARLVKRWIVGYLPIIHARDRSRGGGGVGVDLARSMRARGVRLDLERWVRGSWRILINQNRHAIPSHRVLPPFLTPASMPSYFLTWPTVGGIKRKEENKI